MVPITVATRRLGPQTRWTSANAVAPQRIETPSPPERGAATVGQCGGQCRHGGDPAAVAALGSDGQRQAPTDHGVFEDRHSFLFWKGNAELLANLPGQEGVNLGMSGDCTPAAIGWIE